MDAAYQVGIAAMVDDLGSAAVHGAVQRPIGIYGEQISVVAVAANFGFFAIQALPGILNHLTIRWNTLAGEDSVSMDFGASDQKLETRELLVDSGRFNQVCSHANDLF